MNASARRAALSTLMVTLGAGACRMPSLRSPTAVRLPVESEVSFVESDGHRIRVDVYQPDRAGRHPAAILLHGSGGIHAISPSLVNRYAQVLAEQGIICFVVHYFDGTGDFTAGDSVETANYFHWVRELHDAVTWVRARSDVRPNQVGLMGHSLGAWLAVGVAAVFWTVSVPAIRRPFVAIVYVIPAAVEVSKTTLLASLAPRFANVIVWPAADRKVTVPVPADQSTLSVLAFVQEPVTVHEAVPSTR